MGLGVLLTSPPYSLSTCSRFGRIAVRPDVITDWISRYASRYSSSAWRRVC